MSQKRVTSIAPMPGSLRNAVLGAVAATAIAGCGSDDGTIPSQDAENLLSRLDAIESNVDQQQCEDAQLQADQFASEVRQLPADVDNEVQEGLEQSADRLISLAANDCEAETGGTDEGGVVPTEAETTETPDTTDADTTDTTDEETEQPEETEEPVEPETEEPQQDPDLNVPEGNEGQGGGNVGSDGGVSPSSGGVSGGGGNG